MEADGGQVIRKARLSSSREASPDRARPAPSYASSVRSVARPLRKVQIIYYLSRNGQLEHPHFMELPQLPHQPLRLKDVMDRLTLLRGKGMPSLFSWSCKRSYKNGYVWNDLSENDVIYPSDGVEYVLKGSEIFPGISERFQHFGVNKGSTKSLPISHKKYIEDYRDGAVDDSDDDEEPEYQYHHRAAPQTARLTRADKPGSARTNRSRPIELPVEETSPPSSSSSEKPPATQQPSRAEEPEPSRAGSVLLQLIACGSGAASAKGRAEPRRSCGLQRGLVNRLASRAGLEEEEEVDGELSGRFRDLPVEDKEYFSGSIVEGAGRTPPLPSSLKRSNSHNEERSSRLGIGAIGEERDAGEEKMEGEGIKGRCIPGRKKQQQQK